MENKNSLNDIAAHVHGIAVEHGWWDKAPSFPETVALCHAELSEALEEYRSNHAPTETYFGEGGKPEGIPTELIDCVIRIFDFMANYEIDIDHVLKIKSDYNATRPYKHGGKKI